MKKYLVLGIIILFVGSSVLPSISGNIQPANAFSNGMDSILSVNRANEEECEVNPVNPLDLENPFLDINELIDFGQTAWGATSADFNDDGYVDFAVSSATAPITHSTITIFYNDENLEFTQEDVYIHGGYIKDLDSGDFDRDGDIDLMFTYSETQGSQYTNGVIRILYNNGENQFSFENSTRIARHIDRKHPQLASADFDLDDDLDFICGENPGNVELYLNDGSGNYSSAGIIDDWGMASWGVAAADFDEDGDNDFVVAAETAQGGAIYLKHNQWIESNFTIMFESGLGEKISVLGWQKISACLISADYNNDGAMDFFAGAGAEIYLFINRQGTFESFPVCRFPPSPEGYGENLNFGSMTPADYNNDGYVDIVTGGVQGIVRLCISNHPLAVITKPQHTYLYLFDEEKYPILPINGVIVVGKLTVEVAEIFEVEKVEFYVNLFKRSTVTTPPYNFTWQYGNPIIHRHTLKIKAYSTGGTTASEDKIIKVWRIF